jgi:hypothetical protein
MKQSWKTFKELAFSKGYREKVVGDFAFTKTRRPDSPYIKLISAKNGKIQVSENGERYEV